MYGRRSKNPWGSISFAGLPRPGQEAAVNRGGQELREITFTCAGDYDRPTTDGRASDVHHGGR